MCWFLGYDFVLLQGSRGGTVTRVLASCQHGQGLNIAPASCVGQVRCYYSVLL